eukprot:jgi/Chlat1/7254/Chrsp58S09134
MPSARESDDGDDGDTVAAPGPAGSSVQPLPRTAVVGLLGGGQLGRMIAQAASQLGVKVAVLDPTPDAPASGLADTFIVGSFRDADAVRRLAEQSTVVTVEIEHVNVDVLDELAARGVDVQPAPSTLRTIQDKYLQKEHFAAAGVPLSAFRSIESMEDAFAAGEAFGYPLMVKSRRLAYDGRGNSVARSDRDLASAVEGLGGFGHGLYVEQWAPYIKELAVMVARGKDGELRSYPVVETRHRRNICHTVEAPADIPGKVAKAAMAVAEKAIGSLRGAGVFGVELFLLADGRVLLNEVAPRPHNSGHYTIEACATSQFEQVLRAVLGWPLGDTSMTVPYAAMLNYLGEGEGPDAMEALNTAVNKALDVPGARVHWYGKSQVQDQRKMGHATVVAPTRAVGRERLALVARYAGMDVDLSQRDDGGATATSSSSSTKQSSREEEERAREAPPTGPPVGIIMGSDSDLKVMSAAAEVLEEFGIEFELTVVSAHRTPQRMFDYAQSAHSRGVRVIIAGAGGAAHLPGMVAAMTPLPVIGVPVRATHLDGLDSLLSIVQMPRGVPVATVAINNATNAGLLAVRILATASSDEDGGALMEKMQSYQEGMEDMVERKAAALERDGWRDYKLS